MDLNILNIVRELFHSNSFVSRCYGNMKTWKSVSRLEEGLKFHRDSTLPSSSCLAFRTYVHTKYPLFGTSDGKDY